MLFLPLVLVYTSSWTILVPSEEERPWEWVWSWTCYNKNNSYQPQEPQTLEIPGTWTTILAGCVLWYTNREFQVFKPNDSRPGVIILGVPSKLKVYKGISGGFPRAFSRVFPGVCHGIGYYACTLRHMKQMMHKGSNRNECTRKYLQRNSVRTTWQCLYLVMSLGEFSLRYFSLSVE